MLFKTAIKSIIFKNLKHKLNKNEITEAELSLILKEIRTSFLAADINIKVIRNFLDKVKEEALSLGTLGPNQKPDEVLLKIVRDNLIEILGKNTQPLKTDAKPLKIMMVGLNGSGKTTTSGKLAYYLKSRHDAKVLTVGLDIYRPAAIEQLGTLSKEVSVDFYEKGTQSPLKTAKEALELKNHSAIIFDTAGRLQTNTELMNELTALKKVIEPQEILFVVDAMAGQDILEVAKVFNSALKLTGIIVTKTDSDARMGAAFSIVSTLNLPIKFLGSGEKYSQLSIFHPDRIADRILGMGDLITLAEKAAEAADESKLKKNFFRMLSGQFDLEDLMQQMNQIKSMGSLSSVMSMIPGMKIADSQIDQAEAKMQKWKVLMNSMTLKERRNPKLFKKEPSRKIRVIKGSGCKPDEMNKLLKQWEESKKRLDDFARKLKSGKNPLGGMKF